ncbi:MAG: hypothetical protein WB799_23830, partial [Candidatus Sulfotelmatobacter sp.]
DTAAGYNKRAHIRSKIAKTCIPMLKTNSIQGVLVFGSREKRVSWDTEELIGPFARPSFKPLLGAESFSARGSTALPVPNWIKQIIVYYLTADFPV